LLITPQDIHEQEFKTAFRGYDKDEVDAFLQAVADSYQTLMADNIALKDRCVALESQLRQSAVSTVSPPPSAPIISTNTPAGGGEKSLAELLTYVRDISNSIIDAAKKQAELILQEAVIRARMYNQTRPPDAGH
jgi:cell division initiation protein